MSSNPTAKLQSLLKRVPKLPSTSPNEFDLSLGISLYRELSACFLPKSGSSSSSSSSSPPASLSAADAGSLAACVLSHSSIGAGFFDALSEEQLLLQQPANPPQQGMRQQQQPSPESGIHYGSFLISLLKRWLADFQDDPKARNYLPCLKSFASVSLTLSSCQQQQQQQQQQQRQQQQQQQQSPSPPSPTPSPISSLLPSLPSPLQPLLLDAFFSLALSPSFPLRFRDSALRAVLCPPPPLPPPPGLPSTVLRFLRHLKALPSPPTPLVSLSVESLRAFLPSRGGRSPSLIDPTSVELCLEYLTSLVIQHASAASASAPSTPPNNNAALKQLLKQHIDLLLRLLEDCAVSESESSSGPPSLSCPSSFLASAVLSALKQLRSSSSLPSVLPYLPYLKLTTLLLSSSSQSTVRDLLFLMTPRPSDPPPRSDADLALYASCLEACSRVFSESPCESTRQDALSLEQAARPYVSSSSRALALSAARGVDGTSSSDPSSAYFLCALPRSLKALSAQPLSSSSFLQSRHLLAIVSSLRPPFPLSPSVLSTLLESLSVRSPSLSVRLFPLVMRAINDDGTPAALRIELLHTLPKMSDYEPVARLAWVAITALLSPPSESSSSSSSSSCVIADRLSHSPAAVSCSTEALAFRLCSALVLRNPRLLNRLETLISDYVEAYRSPSAPDNAEVRLAIAASIMDVCRELPDKGAAFVAVLQKYLKDADWRVAEAALWGMHHLVEAGVLDFAMTVKVLQKQLCGGDLSAESIVSLTRGDKVKVAVAVVTILGGGMVEESGSEDDADDDANTDGEIEIPKYVAKSIEVLVELLAILPVPTGPPAESAASWSLLQSVHESLARYPCSTHLPCSLGADPGERSAFLKAAYAKALPFPSKLHEALLLFEAAEIPNLFNGLAVANETTLTSLFVKDLRGESAAARREALERLPVTFHFGASFAALLHSRLKPGRDSWSADSLLIVWLLISQCPLLNGAPFAAVVVELAASEAVFLSGGGSSKGAATAAAAAASSLIGVEGRLALLEGLKDCARGAKGKAFADLVASLTDIAIGEKGAAQGAAVCAFFESVAAVAEGEAKEARVEALCKGLEKVLAKAMNMALDKSAGRAQASAALARCIVE